MKNLKNENKILNIINPLFSLLLYLYVLPSIFHIKIEEKF